MLRLMDGMTPAEPVVRRAWHWGIVVGSDPSLGTQIPDVDPKATVSANANGLVILVRHAQDIDGLDGDLAEVSVFAARLPGVPPIPAGRRAIFQGPILTPRGEISIGDADEDVLVQAYPGRTQVQITVYADADHSPGEIRLSLSPGA
jgi:hypothetical protein